MSNSRVRVLAELLRTTRRSAGLSQLELAHRLGVSQRHVSFLETARTRPSRELLVNWMGEVQAPHSMLNAALLQAGYPPDPGLSRDGEGEVPEVLRMVLGAHEPHVGFVFDARWRIRLANRAAERIEMLVMPHYRRDDGLPDMLESMRHPAGMFSHLRNPAPVAAALLAQLRAEKWAQPDLEARVAALEEELDQRYGPLPPPDDRSTTPYLDLTFDTAIGPLSFTAVQMAPGLPQNITADSLRIELWYPSDAITDALVRANSRLVAAE
jgi:transcriptional regulator with XRE-family HTH domain